MAGGPSKRERRFLDGAREWIVRERDAPDTAGVPGRCLVFMSPAVVRRVWRYPEHWYDLTDVELLALMHAPVRSPRQATRD
jgi:hypothetical protein